MSGGKNVCEAVVQTVNLSAYRSAVRNVPLSKCLLIAPCKTPKFPSCINKNAPVVPQCPPCVPLRLCNPIETRNVCKTEFCPCRPKRPPLTTSQKVAYTFGLAMKYGVVLGLIWITNQQGFWSGHHEITCLYGRLLRRIQCYTGWDIGPKGGEYPQVPRLHTVSSAFTESWNSAVVSVFNVILYIPRTLASYFSDSSSAPQDGKTPPTSIVKKGLCDM